MVFERMYRMLAVAGVAVALGVSAVSAADRVALVVGMGAYEHIPELKNTVNDARVIAQTLEGVGFDVTTLIDAPQAEFETTLAQFAFKSEVADLALIYFAGHGVEVSGENFMVPVDAKVASNRDVQAQSVSLDELLGAVDKARKMRIVILDSCRNNPFGDALATDVVAQAEAGDEAARGSGGLAPAEPDRGTLVAFAARDGQVALDGTGDNSPFAQALAATLPQKGLEISLMFRQVRDRVLDATRNLQEPHTYGSLSGVPFYLAGPGEGAEQPVYAGDPAAAWSRIRPDQELQLAALADGGDTRSMLGLAYMRLNPAEDRFDPPAAVSLLTRAAEAGAPEAQFELAKLYEKGIGVDPDQSRALELFEAAAAQNFADAINDLGFLHYQGGLGLPRDEQKALLFFERAADLRHPQAMYNFAALIDDGLIPSKGPEDAAEYLYQALRSGSQDVLNILLERPNMFKPETRRALQRQLSEYAFYDGSIDGDIGPGTKRGIRRAYGLED